MSKRNALLTAIAVIVVLAVLFLWPEPARADLAVSGRIGSGHAGHSLGGRLHHGDGLRGRVHLDHGHAHGRLHLGGGDRRRFLRQHHVHDHSHGRGLLLGDRFRLHQQRRIAGGRIAQDVLLGEGFRFAQQRRHEREFLGPKHRRGGQAHGHGHGHRHADGHRHRDGYGKGRGHHRHRKDYGKWLAPAPLLLPYGGADVIVREVVVPVLVPVPAERPADVLRGGSRLDARGRAAFVGGEDGVLGGWAEGDILPGDVPHVALDAVAYGLPQPPPGEKYARVGNDVLRIDAGSRRITEVVGR